MKRAIAAAVAGLSIAACGSPSDAPTQAGSSSSMSHDMADMPGMDHSPPGAPSLSLKNSTPAGDITIPSTHMHGGMEMADATPCTAAPTAEQQKAAVALADDTWSGTRQYENLATAQADGYRPVTPSGEPVVHYINRDYYRNSYLGAPTLNTSKPESLVYANTPNGAVLVAAMFINAPFGQPPQPGGCLTQWHIHTNLCFDRGGVVGTTQLGCPAGSENRKTAPMLHVWFVPVPGGPLAVDASDEDAVTAAEKIPSPGNGTA